MLNALSDKQKRCRKNSQGTNDQLYIDKIVLREAKSSKKNLEMGLIDYKKAYDMIPHPGILECLGLFGVAQKITTLLKDSMNGCKRNLHHMGRV